MPCASGATRPRRSTTSDQALQLDPNLAEAHSNLGQLLLEHYRRPEALVHCREAVRLRPNFPEARNNLGNVLRELGRLDEAKACYAEALRLNPDLAITYNNMGQALQEEGKLDEALAWYQQACSATRTRPGSSATWPAPLEELERHEEAIARYELALRLDPNYAEAYSGLGWVRHEQGQFSRGADALPAGLAASARPGRGPLQPGHRAGRAQRFPEARALPPRGAAARPEPRRRRAQLATLLRGKLPEADLAAMRQLVADPDLSGDQALGPALRPGPGARRDRAPTTRPPSTCGTPTRCGWPTGGTAGQGLRPGGP